MTIIVCLDNKNGMLFNYRRQSSDISIRERIFNIIGNNKLLMNEYSARMFEENINKITVDENFLDIAKDNDYCFIENIDFKSFYDKINCVIVYRWNKSYPSDVKFPIEQFENRWNLASLVDFKGNSHDKITEEIYTL